MQLAGKRALVTGGSRGVGAATVLRLAELGASVIVNYLNEKTRADEVVQQAEIFGVTAKPVQADVGKDQDARQLVKETVETLGGLDILVNNAAITRFIDFPDLDDATDEAWASIFETNVYGTFYMTRAAAPYLKVADDAVIVNVGSLSGIGDAGSSIPYCASKAAIHNLTKTLARALAPEVRVNCVAPGGINTEWADGVKGANTREARMQTMAESVHLARACEPEDVADAIVSFVTGNRFVTGQILRVDGGRPV